MARAIGEVKGGEEGIARAARELLRRGGASAVTMRGVARELGCSAGILYRYLEHADALASGASWDVLRKLRLVLLSQLPDGAPAARVVAQAAAYRSFWLAEPRALNFVFQAERNYPGIWEHQFVEILWPELALALGDIDEALLWWTRVHGITQLQVSRSIAPETGDGLFARTLRELEEALASATPAAFNFRRVITAEDWRARRFPMERAA